MSIKENSDSESTFVMLFDEEWQQAAHELSTAIAPAGLPLARQLYLYEQIREYCRDGTEYLVWPNPHLENHVVESRNIIIYEKCRKTGLNQNEKVACYLLHWLVFTVELSLLLAFVRRSDHRRKYAVGPLTLSQCVNGRHNFWTTHF